MSWTNSLQPCIREVALKEVLPEPWKLSEGKYSPGWVSRITGLVVEKRETARTTNSKVVPHPLFFWGVPQGPKGYRAFRGGNLKTRGFREAPRPCLVERNKRCRENPTKLPSPQEKLFTVRNKRCEKGGEKGVCVLTQNS